MSEQCRPDELSPGIEQLLSELSETVAQAETAAAASRLDEDLDLLQPVITKLHGAIIATQLLVLF